MFALAGIAHEVHLKLVKTQAVRADRCDVQGDSLAFETAGVVERAEGSEPKNLFEMAL